MIVLRICITADFAFQIAPRQGLDFDELAESLTAPRWLVTPIRFAHHLIMLQMLGCNARVALMPPAVPSSEHDHLQESASPKLFSVTIMLAFSMHPSIVVANCCAYEEGHIATQLTCSSLGYHIQRQGSHPCQPLHRRCIGVVN